ncbi:unnamed protein product, partial [Brassica oleracea]
MEKLSWSIKRIWYKIDAPLNEQKARLLMMVLLLHHNGAAKIGCLIISLTICFFVEGSSRRRFHTLRWEKKTSLKTKEETKNCSEA